MDWFQKSRAKAIQHNVIMTRSLGRICMARSLDNDLDGVTAGWRLELYLGI